MEHANGTRRIGWMLVCALALVTSAPVSGATDECDGHTDDGVHYCTQACDTGDRVGISIYADDEDEIVEATTTCNSSNAHCDGRDECKAYALAPAARGARWTCSFSAQDAWYFPNNGFHYNCYRTPENGMPTPSVGIVCDYLEQHQADCAGNVEYPEVLDGILGASSVQPRFADVWVEGATAQRLVEVGPDGVTGYHCEGGVCAPIAPACLRVGAELRCVV